MVDNGSTDGSVAGLRELFPDLEIIETGANLGYAGGCNVGIETAQAHGAEFVGQHDDVAICDFITGCSLLIHNASFRDSHSLRSLTSRRNAYAAATRARTIMSRSYVAFHPSSA